MLQLSCLHDEPLPQKIHLGSPLLKSFQEFITSTFIHVIDVMWFILDGIDPSEYQSLPINVSTFCLLLLHSCCVEAFKLGEGMQFP